MAYEGRAAILSEPGKDVEVVDIVVDPDLTLRAAHDIGHLVEQRLVAEADVAHATAHLDVEDDEPPPERG